MAAECRRGGRGGQRGRAEEDFEGGEGARGGNGGMMPGSWRVAAVVDLDMADEGVSRWWPPWCAVCRCPRGGGCVPPGAHGARLRGGLRHRRPRPNDVPRLLRGAGCDLGANNHATRLK